MKTNTETTLLLFRLSLAELREQWKIILPDDWSAVVASGGVSDFWRKKKDWINYVSGEGPFPDTPFLQFALPSLIATVLESLIGSEGRLYVMFDDDASAAPAYGLSCPDKGCARYTLKLAHPANAAREWIWPTFFTIGSSGLAAGFWGPTTRFERQLGSVPDVVVTRQPNDMPAAHKALFNFLRGGLVPSDLQLPPLLMCPFGGEEEDGLLVSNRMSQDEMLERIRGGLPDEVEILEFGDGCAYERWVREGVLAG